MLTGLALLALACAGGGPDGDPADGGAADGGAADGGAADGGAADGGAADGGATAPCTAGEGLAGGRIDAAARACVEGSGTLGSSLAAAGDGDGDGVGELLLGDPATGTVHLLGAPPPGLTRVPEASRTLLLGPPGAGVDLAAGRDLDDDGAPDLAVGDPTAGRVYVLRGPLPAGALELSAAGLQVVDAGAPGAALVLVGDLERDGRADLGVGAPEADLGAGPAGAVGLWHGGPLPGSGELALAEASTWVGAEQAGARLGATVEGVGDVDGDGVDDLVLGAPGQGRAWLLTGPPPAGAFAVGDLAAQRFVAAAPDLGTSATGAGDVDGDGVADLAFGAPGAACGAAGEVGRAWIVVGVGRSAELDLDDGARLRIDGAEAGARTGQVVEKVGDLDGDGRLDLAVAEPCGGAGQAGRVGLLVAPLPAGTLAFGSLALLVEGAAAGEHLGEALAPGGDLDGDGRDEALLGAPGGARVYLWGG